MENTKISIELEKWQVVALRNYFGQNDKTQVAHWAFSVFDESLKSNHKSTSQKETIERLRHFVQTFKEGVDDCSILIAQDDESEFGEMFYELAEQLLSTTEQPKHCHHDTSKISDDGQYWICSHCGERQSD